MLESLGSQELAIPQAAVEPSGRVFVALNLALALALTAGLILAGSGSPVAAWTAFTLTIPFMVFILPYFVGVILMGRGSDGALRFGENSWKRWLVRTWIAGSPCS